jgi:winged helix DNA-binding protein
MPGERRFPGKHKPKNEMPERRQSKQSVKWSQISAFRMRRHHLLGEPHADLDTVTQDVCGVQAQVDAAAKMALWARMHHLTRREIHSALWESRSLVKTACMRGTLHLLSASDFPVYINAFKRSRTRQALQIMARYGVSQQEAYRVRDAVVEALANGPLTRRELTEPILSSGIVSGRAKAWFEQSSWGVVRQAVFEGLICYGPGRGQEVTLVRTDHWLPGQREIPEMEAQQVVLRRYLGAYGPAVPQDFSKWSGFSMKEVSAVWESLAEDLAKVQTQGRKRFILRKDLDELTENSLAGPIVRLLPNFDPYMLGHDDKGGLVTASFYKLVYRQQWWISPVVLHDGSVIGTWSYARGGKRLSLHITPFKKPSKTLRSMIEEEAISLGHFLESSLEIEFTD